MPPEGIKRGRDPALQRSSPPEPPRHRSLRMPDDPQPRADPTQGTSSASGSRFQLDERRSCLFSIGPRRTKKCDACRHQRWWPGLDRIMPRQAMLMPLAFNASQHLDLPVQRHAERLPAYLQRTIGCWQHCWTSKLTRLGPGRISLSRHQPSGVSAAGETDRVIADRTRTTRSTMLMRAVDCELEGLGVVDDFQLTLEAILNATIVASWAMPSLAVRVSQPAAAQADSEAAAGKHRRIHPQGHPDRHQGPCRSAADELISAAGADHREAISRRVRKLRRCRAVGPEGQQRLTVLSRAIAGMTLQPIARETKPPAAESSIPGLFGHHTGRCNRR